MPAGRPRSYRMGKPRRGDRGHSGRRPRTIERTPERAKGLLRRSRTRATSRATMIDRPRAGARHGRTHRLRHRYERIASRHRGAIVTFRAVKGRRSTAAAPSVPRGGPVPVRSARSDGRYAPGDPGPAIGKVPHLPRPWSPPGRAPRVYSPSFQGRVEAAPDRGGHAIARSGRVVRPVRRPTDRQTNARHRGGDPREICNHSVPSPRTRDLSILWRSACEMAGAA